MNARALASLASFMVMALSSVARADGSAPPPPPEVPAESRVPNGPDTGYVWATPQPYPTLPWILTQLIPSPEIVVGQQRRLADDGSADNAARVAFGLRWQVTPVLWSFGVHRRVSGWRFLVVDPIARQSGSLELSVAGEYIAGHVDRFLVRPGLRMYFPIAQRGEYLSGSIGTSAYSYDGLRVAYDVGIYTLGGVLGLQMTFAPAHDPMAAIATVRIRYF